jgi:hypothetical protein
MKMSITLEAYRIRSGPYASNTGNPYGAFMIPGALQTLKIIADDGAETRWEHVSVSTDKRTPTWDEMCLVKKLFWKPEDCVVQFHPPESRYVNAHPFCLHLWRHLDQQFPAPPMWLVGPSSEVGVV